jgi:hypothetical protein
MMASLLKAAAEPLPIVRGAGNNAVEPQLDAMGT